jgi:hypothetical protein
MRFNHLDYRAENFIFNGNRVSFAVRRPTE